MSRKPVLRREGLPSWFAPFDRFIDYVFGVDELTHLAEDGIRRIQDFPKLVRHFFDEDDSEDERKAGKEWLEEQEKFAQLAQSEIDRDFPVLHGHALMGAWGALECLIEDLAVAWLVGQQPLGS
jgi:hypothetical protein